MDGQNPYATPRADLGQTNFGAEGVGGAIAELRDARGSMLGVGIALAVMAVVSCFSTLSVLMSVGSDMGGTYLLPYMTMATGWLADLAAALAVFWLRAQITGLAGDPRPERLTAVLGSLGRFWLIATAAWCVPAVLGLGVSLVQFILPAVGMALVATGDDPVRAASRLRTSVQAFLIAGAVLLIGKAASQLVGPMAQTYAPIKIWLFGGILMQLALGAIVWLQIPPLEAFIATPTPAALTTAATAQKTTWRYLFIFLLASFVLSWLGNFALRFIPG